MFVIANRNTGLYASKNYNEDGTVIGVVESSAAATFTTKAKAEKFLKTFDEEWFVHEII